jgi:hypothetical protein
VVFQISNLFWSSLFPFPSLPFPSVAICGATVRVCVARILCFAFAAPRAWAVAVGIWTNEKDNGRVCQLVQVATLEPPSFVRSFVRLFVRLFVRSFVDERENKKSGLYAVGDFDRERRFFGEPSKPLLVCGFLHMGCFSHLELVI